MVSYICCVHFEMGRRPAKIKVAIPIIAICGDRDLTFAMASYVIFDKRSRRSVIQRSNNVLGLSSRRAVVLDPNKLWRAELRRLFAITTSWRLIGLLR